MADITNARYWWAVMYPENMVENWQDVIGDLVQYPYCYILHDKDLRHESKEERKTHIHLIIAFNNTTTYNHALKIFSRLNADGKNAIPNNRFEACVNVGKCYDYLIHNTDECRKKHKHLYNSAERISGNNFDIGLFEQYSLEEKIKAAHDMALILRKEFFTNYEDFCEYIEDNYSDNFLYIQLLDMKSAYFERRTKGNYQKLLRSMNGGN